MYTKFQHDFVHNTLELKVLILPDQFLYVLVGVDFGLRFVPVVLCRRVHTFHQYITEPVPVAIVVLGRVEYRMLDFCSPQSRQCIFTIIASA